jgi:hypothetical protein
MLDLLGRPLEQARALLDAEGYAVEVRETRPPRPGVQLLGALRVVRQSFAGGTARLVVAHERYAPPAGRA